MEEEFAWCCLAWTVMIVCVEFGNEFSLGQFSKISLLSISRHSSLWLLG